jgi:hypothetical protein
MNIFIIFLCIKDRLFLFDSNLTEKDHDDTKYGGNGVGVVEVLYFCIEHNLEPKRSPFLSLSLSLS